MTDIIRMKNESRQAVSRAAHETATAQLEMAIDTLASEESKLRRMDEELARQFALREEQAKFVADCTELLRDAKFVVERTAHHRYSHLVNEVKSADSNVAQHPGAKTA